MPRFLLCAVSTAALARIKIVKNASEPPRHREALTTIFRDRFKVIKMCDVYEY